MEEMEGKWKVEKRWNSDSGGQGGGYLEEWKDGSRSGRCGRGVERPWVCGGEVEQWRAAAPMVRSGLHV